MLIPFAHLTQADLPWTDGVAVVPIAAMETHGPHLPLGTDGLIAEGILDRAAPMVRAQAACLPLHWIGASAEHADHPGTVSIESEALIADLVAVGEGLARAGIRRVVLFNGHGGNVAAAAIAALKLRTRFGLLAASAHWLDFGLPPGLTPPAPVGEDVHGGWVETSVLLHLEPAWVEMAAAKPARPSSPAPSLFPAGPIAWGWKIDDLAQGGFIGRPDLATAELGEKLVNHAAERLAGLIDEIAEASWPSA